MAKRIDKIGARQSMGGRPLHANRIRTIEKAVLKTLPDSGPGMLFDELVDDVAHLVNPLTFPLRRTVSRYTKVVQLELEKRGEIERIPGQSPIRLRRKG